MRGRIAKLAAGAGYGFIVTDDGQEFFFNQSALKGTDFGELGLDVPVEFEIDREVHGDRPGEDPRAVNVRLAPDAIPAVDNEVLPAQKVNP